jgi:hypothetical protein
MHQPNSIDEFVHRDEQMDRKKRINDADWDLQQPLQPLTRVVSVPHVEEWGCRCVQTDVDEWDARGCPEHGNPDASAEADAAELVAYYAVDPDLAARKPVRNEQVAEPLRSIINAFSTPKGAA